MPTRDVDIPSDNHRIANRMTDTTEFDTSITTAARIYRWVQTNSLRIAVPACIVVMAIGVAFVNPRFLSVRNFNAILYGVAPAGIVGMGMALLLFSGRFDLSVGGIAALSAVAGARAINAYGLINAIPLVLAIGIVCGCVNSFVIFRLKVNSFVATLGTGYAFSGTAAVLSGQSPVSLKDLALSDILNGSVAGIPLVIYLYVAIVLLAFWYSHTVAGRALYAVGANEEAARYAGVPVTLVSVLPFVITGAFCAIAGLVTVGYNAAGLATTGSDWPLTAIAGAVIGGVSITGGDGSIIGAFIGMILIGVVQNALVFIDIDTNYQTIILGIVIILAVTTDILARKRLLQLGARRADAKPPAEAAVVNAPAFLDAVASRPSEESTP